MTPLHSPQKVRDPKFRGSEFFDPHDAVQVKYEMLRRVSINKVSVTEASDEYGVSRPTYLLSGQGGLRYGRHCRNGADEAMAPQFPQDRRQGRGISAGISAPGEPVRAQELAKLLRQELDIELHPRSIEPVLKKSGR